MYYPDLMPYEYIPAFARPSLLNVGWLDERHPYPTGRVPEEFLDRLFELCANHWTASTRGFHYCPFCTKNISATNRPARTRAVRDGVVVPLGSAEIRVVGEQGCSYAAPNLIYHYCTVHSYQPPPDFINAVLHYMPDSHSDPTWCEACSARPRLHIL